MNNLLLFTNYYMGKMRRTFFMSYPETSHDYKKSRVYYTVADSASQTIVQLTGGTFLVILMESLNISDGNKGILASFGSLAAISQLISMKLANRIVKNKLFVCITVLQKFWFSFIFFIPLMKISNHWAKIFMVVLFCYTQICIQIGTPATVDWIASLVPPKYRGRYFSIKDSVAVFVVVTVMLIMGIMVDITKKINLHYTFIILGITIAILTTINVIALTKMNEPKLSYLNDKGQEMIGRYAKKNAIYHKISKNVNLIHEIKIAFSTSNFRKLLIFNCLWMTSFYIASPFNSSFQIKDLNLPYTYIMILTFVMNLLRIYLTPKAGKLSDRIGMSKVMGWALSAMGIHYLLMSFTIPKNAYLMTAFALLFSSLGWTFIGIGLLGIQLEFLTEEKRIVQYSLISIISGLYGFVISILGARIISFIQQNKWSFGGHYLYAQQYTNILGFIFILITILYLNKRIQSPTQ